MRQNLRIQELKYFKKRRACKDNQNYCKTNKKSLLKLWKRLLRRSKQHMNRWTRSNAERLSSWNRITSFCSKRPQRNRLELNLCCWKRSAKIRSCKSRRNKSISSIEMKHQHYKRQNFKMRRKTWMMKYKMLKLSQMSLRKSCYASKRRSSNQNGKQKLSMRDSKLNKIQINKLMDTTFKVDNGLIKLKKEHSLTSVKALKLNRRNLA